MQSRTRYAVLAGGAAMALFLTACSGGSGSTGSGDGTSGGAEPVSTEFTYWSQWKEGESQQIVMAQAIEDFEAETGITVNVEWQGRQNVQSTVPTLSTPTVPDLIDSSYLKLYPSLVATSQAHSMADAWATEVDGGKTVADLVPATYLDSIDITGDDGDPWMVPYTLSTDSIWYNAAEHPEIAANPPATWDELIALLDQLKANGETPIALDGDIPGYNVYWFSSILMRLEGPGSLYALASDKTGAAWDDPNVLKAAEMVQQLVDGGYFIDGYGASKFPTQQQQWADNQAALLFMGPWVPTETAPYAADGFEYASFPFPAVGDSSVNSARADFTGFAVPANAEHADAAQQFAAFFLRTEYQTALAQDAEILPIRADVDVAPSQTNVYTYLQGADSYYQQNDGVAFPGYNDQVFFALDDALVLGSSTAQQFVDAARSGTVEYWESQG